MFGLRRIGTLLVIIFAGLLLSCTATQPALAQASEPALESDIAQPGILARVRLTDTEHAISDFRYDPATERLYVTTSDGQLHVIDAEDYSVIDTISVGGQLTLDSEGGRLYVGAGDQYVVDGETPSVHVFDTATLSEIGELDGVHAVSLDKAGKRLFAGSPVGSSGVGVGSDSIHVYDLDSLEPLYELELAGVPTYNPLGDELLVTNYTVAVVDPESGEILEDLLPQLEEQPFPWCNGCEYATGAHVLPSKIDDGSMLVITMAKMSTGGGPGFEPATVYLDAATYEPIEDYTERTPLQHTRGTEIVPLHPINEYVIEQQQYNRYVHYNNLVVNNLDGQPLTWRDGISANYINERKGQAYTTQGIVLNLETLSPEGRIVDFDLLSHDSSTGRIFGAVDGSLVVIGENSGLVYSPIPSEPEPMPKIGIEQIDISPAYADDEVLFVLMKDSRLYRSSDSGQSWTRVQGGLPTEPGVVLSVALSPSFGDDQTVFAGGRVGEATGEGVWKSTDGGLNWEPSWMGLEHLRVWDVAVSDNFASNGTLYAVTDYTRLEPWENGSGLFVSTDEGSTWSLEMTATFDSEIESYIDINMKSNDELPIRIASSGRVLERLDDSGEWSAANLEQKEGERLIDIVPSPMNEDDNTYYVLGDFSVWRTTDDGETWSRWRDPRLVNLDYENALTALAVTPELETGGYQLLVGARDGQLWILTPQVKSPTGQRSNDAIVADIQDEPEPADETTEQPKLISGEEITDTVSSTDTVNYLKATPPEGLYHPDGSLATIWEAFVKTRDELGWAKTELSTNISAAFQPFERGAMLWNGDSQMITVLYDDGTYQQFKDTFEEGDQEFDPSLTPPGGALQPIRGFGEVWRENQTVRNGIGWALTKESGYNGFLHHFEKGELITTPSGTVQLIPDGEFSGIWHYAY